MDQPRVPAGNSQGGQWTSGGGASVAAVADDPARPGYIRTTSVFQHESDAEFAHVLRTQIHQRRLTPTQREVAHADLVATQTHVLRETLEHFATPAGAKDAATISSAKFEPAHAAGVEYEGKIYVLDGHHRLSYAALRGASSHKMMVYSL